MTIFSFPQEINPEKNIMPEDNNLGALDFLSKEKARLEAEDAADAELKSSQEVRLDGSNKVSMPGFAYSFEALGERILVSLDIPLSGFECKVCKGKKRIKYECECVTSGHPGVKYSQEELGRLSDVLGAAVAVARGTQPCPSCGGDPASVRRNDICAECNGMGGVLWIPRKDKELPCTGVVVSMGSIAREKASFKVGDRILFSQHAGSMIPNKAGLPFKYMDWYAGAIRIEGADEISAFDFILSSTE
jgi:hypothetical protein